MGQSLFLEGSNYNIYSPAKKVADNLTDACSFANVISTFVIQDHMLDWHLCQICFPLEMKLLLLLL